MFHSREGYIVACRRSLNLEAEVNNPSRTPWALSIACCMICSEIPAAPRVCYRPQVRQEESAGTKNKTVIDMTAAELRLLFPSAPADLSFDPNQDELSFLLWKVGEKVEAFFRDFSNTSSKEQVRLQRFNYNGRKENSTSQEFNYLILSHSGKAGLELVEDRVDRKGRPSSTKGTSGFFISAGYAGLSLYFRPSHQPGSRFRYLGRQTSEPRAHVIAFAQKTEAGEYLSGYSDANYLESTGLLLQGIAWVDPDTLQIVRMRTNLLATEHPVHLMEQTTDIRFSEVHFDGIRQSFWLPREVVVSFKVAGKTYLNRHRYSEYKLFTVESYDKINQPQIKK